MPIVDADLVFRQSERMTDFADGGGRMSTVVVLDGVKNNLFPDVTDVDRLTGRVSLRKVYAAALNADTDTLLSAHVLLDVPPADAATSAMIFALRGWSGFDGWKVSSRASVVSFLDSCVSGSAITAPNADDPGTVAICNAAWTGGDTTVTLTPAQSFHYQVGGSWLGIPVGAVVGVYLAGVTTLHTVTAGFVARRVYPGDPVGETLVVTPALPGSGSQTGTLVVPAFSSAYRLWGVATAPGVSALGATSITVGSTWTRVAPADPATPYPPHSDAIGINTSAWQITHGLVPVIRPGDAVLIHHSAIIGPASVSNGQVVDTGRTVLARLRIIGNNGVEHYRATAGQAPVGSGATADLDAGTVTIVDVSGFSQPVTIEHRIEEMALATTVGLTTIGINRALSRQYPAGTRVSSLLMSGDLQGRAADGFAQTAWTGVWQDAVIGGTPLGDYNEASYPITTTNAGAVTQRWAVIFTTTQAFRVVGEDLGEIGTGTTMSEYAPVNPATGQPFFRIPAAGWGSGWAAGNVYRFNTTGSNTPVWVLRCVAPSLPSGADAVTLQLRGYVSS